MGIKIIDVIHHKNKYATQHFLIVSRFPDLMIEARKIAIDDDKLN